MRYCWETNPKVGFFNKVFQKKKNRIEKGGELGKGNAFNTEMIRR